MKITNKLKTFTSFQLQPTGKPRTFSSLSLRHRFLYGRTRRCFTGKELDSETGLYYYGARYLDPKTSRWLSGDPALGEYLPSAPINDEARKRNGNLPGMGGVFNYVNLHVYHYAGNNPVKLVDPDGRDVHIRITARVVGTGVLRNGPPGSNVTVTVPTYKMTVTDDVTGKVTSYQVTRHSVYDTEKNKYDQKYSYEPRNESKRFRGLLSDKKNEGIGRVIYLFEDMDGRKRGDLYRSDNGEKNDAFIEIHVGGKYINTKTEREDWATSWGCFALNGPDAGNEGRDKFMDDVATRYEIQTEATGKRIYITVDRME